MNYFFLELDTTAPDIEIYSPTTSTTSTEFHSNALIQAPATTTRVMVDEIRVESSEPTLEWQNIYAIDAKGTKHEFTFNRESDTAYVGQVTFSGFPYGIATIFAQLQDSVGNLSRLATFNINVIPVFNYYNLNMNLTESVRNVDISENSLVTTSDKSGILSASDRPIANLEIYDTEVK